MHNLLQLCVSTHFTTLIHFIYVMFYSMSIFTRRNCGINWINIHIFIQIGNEKNARTVFISKVNSKITSFKMQHHAFTRIMLKVARKKCLRWNAAFFIVPKRYIFEKLFADVLLTLALLSIYLKFPQPTIIQLSVWLC